MQTLPPLRLSSSSCTHIANNMAGFSPKYFLSATLLSLLWIPALAVAMKPTFVGCLDQRCYNYFTDRLSWEFANMTCRMYSTDTHRSHLASLHNQDVLDLFVGFSRTQGFPMTSWVGGHEREFPQWQWLNGGHNNKDIVKEYYNGGDRPFCGTINAGLHYYEVGGSVCHEKKRYFCTKGAVYSMRYLYEVVEDEALSYQSTEHLSWFDARNACLSKGMDLAIVPGEVAKAAYYYFTHDGSKRKEYWIGLTRNTWFWDGAGQRLTYTKFKPGEPSKRDEKCLLLADDSGYADTYCAQRYPFFCESRNATDEELNPTANPFNTDTTSSNTAPNFTVIIIGSVVAVVMLICLGIIILVCLIARRPKTGKEERERNHRTPSATMQRYYNDSYLDEGIRSYNNGADTDAWGSDVTPPPPKYNHTKSLPRHDYGHNTHNTRNHDRHIHRNTNTMPSKHHHTSPRRENEFNQRREQEDDLYFDSSTTIKQYFATDSSVRRASGENNNGRTYGQVKKHPSVHQDTPPDTLNQEIMKAKGMLKKTNRK